LTSDGTKQDTTQRVHAYYHELGNTEPPHLTRRNAAYFNLSILLIVNLYSAVARKIPFEDPLVLNYVRLAYVVSQLVMLAAYYYVSIAVRLHLLSIFYFIL
jgi:hypothetical protein